MFRETGKEKWHECRATIHKEWGLGMFSVDLRNRSSVGGRRQAGYGAWHVWSAACDCFRLPFLLSPSLLPFSFISSYSSVFPHFLHSFPRFVPMDVTQVTRYSLYLMAQAQFEVVDSSTWNLLSPK